MNSGKQRKQRGLSLFFRLTSHRKPRISAANELPATDNFLEKQRKQRGNDKASGLRLWLRAWTTVGRVAPIAKPTDTPVIRKVNACRFAAKAGGARRHAPSRAAIRRKGHSGPALRVLPGTARQGPAARGRNLWTPASGKSVPGSPLHGARNDGR